MYKACLFERLDQMNACWCHRGVLRSEHFGWQVGNQVQMAFDFFCVGGDVLLRHTLFGQEAAFSWWEYDYHHHQQQQQKQIKQTNRVYVLSFGRLVTNVWIWIPTFQKQNIYFNNGSTFGLMSVDRWFQVLLRAEIGTGNSERLENSGDNHCRVSDLLHVFLLDSLLLQQWKQKSDSVDR